MKYTIELDINLPRREVAELFGNPDNRQKWQPDLVVVEPLSGDPGRNGSKTLLKYRMGKAFLEMTETVLDNHLPERFIATYEAKGVWNKVENVFQEMNGGVTRWIFTTEFKCSGFMRFAALFSPGMFKRQSRKQMNQFKAFVEGTSVARAATRGQAV